MVTLYYLGIDGGGSKTNFILINMEGRILSNTTKGSCHYLQVGLENFEQILRDGISEVCTKAEVDIQDISYSFLGLPAFGENRENVSILEAIVQNITQSRQFRCGNDVEAGWAGSLACQPGINLVAGTGAIGFGKDHLGNTARAGGWGYYCGDEGSAYWLGKKLISLYSKEADGREVKTPLYDIVRQEFKITRDFDFITIIFDVLKLKRDEIAKLALLVYRAAEQGDPKAVTLYKEAAYEHSLTVKAIYRQLRKAEGEDFFVSYSGGVFKAGDLIIKPLQTYLAGEPLRLIRPILQPVTGAALYAMILDGKSADESFIDKLQKQEGMYLTR